MSDWIQTFTGKKFYPLFPHRNVYDIRDIAHALSMKCRFGGHVREFYSVGEHCCRVSQIVKPSNQMWALLHDAAEAYLPDVASPIKGSVYLRANGDLKTMQDIEGEMLAIIARQFGIPASMPSDVKQADLIMLATEARDLMEEPPEEWTPDCPMLPDPIEPWESEEAENQFLKMFSVYSERMAKMAEASR